MKSNKTARIIPSKGDAKIVVIIAILVIVVIGYFVINKSRVQVNVTPKTVDYSVQIQDIGNNQVKIIDKTHGFSLVYPKDWSRQDTNTPIYSGTDGSTYTVFPILRPPVTQSVDQGNGTINIINSEEKTTFNSLKDYVSNQLAIISKYENYEAISSEGMTLAGLPAYKIIYTITAEGRDIKAMQVYILKENKGYVFTYRISPENYSTYENTANQILSSIQFN